jgi:hypothetical protein
MNIEDLDKILFEPEHRSSALDRVSDEVFQYEICLQKKGSSCSIYLTGDRSIDVCLSDVKSIHEYLSKNRNNYFVDYILSAIQMSDLIKKDEDVMDYISNAID